MSAHPLGHHPSRAGRIARAVALCALLTVGLTASSFARPRLGGGGGGNIGGHFSGTVHFSGGGVHPGYRPIPPHPHPHPVPRPIPRPIPHPPRPPVPPPYPHPYPYPHPAWWIPGVAAWSNAWDSTTLVYVLPSHCQVLVVDSIKYAECGSTWYEMVYHGTQLAYLPVSDPR